MVQKEVQTVARMIGRKHVSLAQMIYINNRILLPRIEYRMQHCLLSRNTCDRLQSSIWKTIKNKANMAITVANSVLTHKHIAGQRSIWQNQMSHHMTELRVRMNDATCIGRATWLRIKQGQLNCKSRHCITDLNSSSLTRFKVAHNLAYKIIAAAKELDVVLHSNEISESLNIHAKGTEIVDLLSDKAVQSFCNEKKMRIIVVEQLLDSSHSFLLTWGQLRKCKLNRAMGRKPTWFAEIKQKLLDEPDTRRIKTEWQQEKRNDLAPRAELLKISTDKRKKEWIVFKTKGIMEFGRIVKKSDKSWIEIEHWHMEKDDLAYATRLKKCNGCHLNETHTHLRGSV